jgi:hypothetical protein
LNVVAGGRDRLEEELFLLVKGEEETREGLVLGKLLEGKQGNVLILHREQ